MVSLYQVSKICRYCNSDQPLSEFKKAKTCVDGHSHKCRSCSNKAQRSYRKKTDNSSAKVYDKTKKGFLVRTYRNMLSRVRGIQTECAHLYEGLEILDKSDFYTWSLSDKDFNDLFEAWILSDTPMRICPSIDRVNTSLGYVGGNIRWITQSENSRLGGKCVKSGFTKP